ncbi:hypothetical protein FB446DRAFT_656764 [Lentinula raphanica]|nr:hypothetical protein C8R42DRAFT_581387 [Lentinula raphanica]KAJ3759822.1 hypothetical protein EV360DRAFT_41150 [Lentinula raphanica]KAJ3779084.1 hypothetical protein FB446DRAFT_656764 [Lentinula raphanica]
MTTVPAPSLAADREEWPDADFDLPEGQPLHADTDKDDGDEMDWDVEMDLGKTGGASAFVRAHVIDLEGSSKPQMVTIRPAQIQQGIDEEEDDEGVSTIKVNEGVSTIKLAALPKPDSKKAQVPIDEDFEDGFALPSDLTQLSLAPLSLNHRSSKNSIEWGDKDHTSSSQSSDAYSTLGFANASPSSNSTSSASLPDTETEDEDEDDHMDGLVIPSGLFESRDAGSKLTHLLELRQKAVLASDSIKVASPDPEEDFEMGLVIDDDVDLSPSRLLYSAQQMRHANRSQSMPNSRPKQLRLASTRVKSIDRAKSPINPPVSSTRQFQKLRLSPSPPLNPPSRSQTFQTLSSAPSPSPSSSSFLAPKPGSLRGQKSHSGLKPPTPPASTRKLTRKASLSSLLESGSSQASGSGTAAGPSKARYEEPTVASRAKSQRSTSRLRGLDYPVPPTRPSTPSSNPNAVRLTLPTATRVKSRPALSSLFNHGAPSSPGLQPTTFRTASPIPPRPPSNLSNRAPRIALQPLAPSAPKVMKRPKRQRTYGDGTELDAFEDLPTDRDKESRFRVQPKGYGNRIPGGTFPTKPSAGDKNATDKNTIRRKRREVSGGSESSSVSAPTANSLRRSSRLDSPTAPKQQSPKKKSKTTSKKKPTLIRNLGGVGAPKVVGDMHWNPQTLRWEGNEQVLRDFDSVVTSTRPALITHLTGSSIGSPVGSFATGARKVGNMIFDPQRMCWISTLPPEEEEPDVFANLADDEEEEDAKGDTVRLSLQSASATPDTSVNSRTSTSMSGTIGDTSPTSHNSYTRAPSESGSDRGSRASMVYDIDGDFIAKCRAAEQRHVVEMKGWKEILAKQDVLYEAERPNLYEIRDLATRKY